MDSMVRNGQSLPLLQTKLYAPPIRRGMVIRSALRVKLDDGLRSGRHLSLISAPTGYGKTTLVREWLEGTGLPYAWFSLDAGDNDPVRFLTYFIAALQGAVGRFDPEEGAGLGETVRMMLRTPQPPATELLLTLLINDLMEISGRMICVLDDYHLIQNEAVHQAIQFFLDHQPPRVHLVLTTRQDPPLVLARFRMQDLLTEIRVHELRFTLEEMEQFFQECADLRFSAGILAALESRTEGWIAGLQLVALALRGLPPGTTASFIENFSGSHRFMTDYLFEEVLRLQPAEIGEFLRATAILPQFCASLCDAVTGRQDSREMLERLDKANLFLIELDNRQHWYRYHHLFAEYLQSELEPARRAELHLRAAHWSERENLLVEGVQHALAAGVMDEAMRLMGAAVQQLLERGETATYLRWFDTLPPESVRKDPEISVLRAWGYYLRGQMNELEGYLRSIEDGWDRPAADQDRGRLLCLRSYISTNKGLPGSFALAAESVRLIGESDPLFRTLALLALGQEQCAAGNFSLAIETFREAFSFAQRLEMPFATLLAVNYLTENLLRAGRIPEADAVCRQVMRQYQDRNGCPTPLSRMNGLTMSRICLACNDLPGALEYAQDGLSFGQEMGMANLIIDGEVNLAAIQISLGETEQALDRIRRLQQMAGQMNLPQLDQHLAALEADLKLKMGDPVTALAILEKAGLRLDDSVGHNEEQRYYALVRTRLVLAQYAEVQPLLGRLETLTRNGQRNGSFIPVRIWQAIAAHGLRQEGKAEEYLGEALRLAAPEGYLHPFVRDGVQIASLLPSVRHLAPDFVQQIMEVLGEGAENLPPEPHRANRPSPASLLDSLSERETEILRLVSEGLSNLEIGGKLCITVGTVKWHLANIYSKLHVRRRTQAVELGRKLHLI